MTAPAKPRFELVVRIVRDDAEKKDYPEYRHVLHEIAVPVMTEWNTGMPADLRPEQIMAMTDLDILMNTAAPIIEQMQKAPINTMVVQCMQGYQDKLAKASVARPPPAEKKD